jgi:hypothetical protein
MPNKNLQRESAGEASVTVLTNLRWTSANGGERTGSFGDEVFNPTTGQKQRLPGDATFGDLTLETAYSTSYAQQLDAWIQRNGGRTDLVVVSTIDDIRYTFINCTIRTDGTYPGFNKNGTTTNTKTLRLVLGVGGRNPLT